MKSKGRIKRSHKEHEVEEEGTASSGDGRVLCCVPRPLDCPQKVISDPETAVRMGCTNVHCSSPRLLHLKCFDRLEKQLVTAVLSSASKKWSEENRAKKTKANVWDCGRIDLVQRMCSCSCGGILRKEEAGIPLPKSVVRKKSRTTAFEASSSLPKTDQRVSKFPYPSLKTDLSQLMNLYFKSASEPSEERLEEEEDASKQLFVSGIPRGCSKQDILDCFEQFGKVLNVWISSHPFFFAFVTFDSPKSVDNALKRDPILLFGRHRLNVERKRPHEPRVKAKEMTRYRSADQVSSSSAPPSGDSQLTSLDTEVPTLVDQGAMRGDLGAGAGYEEQETEDGSTTEEIYWSDEEEEERGQFEDNSWSQEELLSNLMTFLEVQEQLDQERVEWIPEKKEIETDRLRLEPDHENHEAQRIKLEAENQVLRDNLEMTKEQLKIQDARVKMLEETKPIMEKRASNHPTPVPVSNGEDPIERVMRLTKEKDEISFICESVEVTTKSPCEPKKKFQSALCSSKRASSDPTPAQALKADISEDPIEHVLSRAEKFELEASLLTDNPNVRQNPGGQFEVTLEPGVATSFKLQLKNVHEVVRKDSQEPTRVVITQIGAGGVVELSDRHGVTGDKEGEFTKIRIKYGEKYNVSVRCQSNHDGELKIPVFVFFHHDALSEIEEDEESEIMMVRSNMVVSLLVRMQTESNVGKKKVSMSTGRTFTEESLIRKKPEHGLNSQPKQGAQPHGWQCTSCEFVNNVDASVCEKCDNTWLKWHTGSQSQGSRQSKPDSNKKVSMERSLRDLRKQEGEEAKVGGRSFVAFGDRGASPAKKETSVNDTAAHRLKKKDSMSAGESQIQDKLNVSGWECSFCSSHNAEDASECGMCKNTIPNLLWFQWG